MSLSTITRKTNNSFSNKNGDNFLHIPCTNCGNWIHLDQIEEHSNICVMAKPEIISSESSQYAYKSIDYKLTKLFDHLNSLKTSQFNEEYASEMHYIVSLLHYNQDALNIVKISCKSLVDLKKILINIDVNLNFLIR